MEFTISSNDLAKGLYRAQGIVEKKTAMPILSNVLFHASPDGKVSITATDLEVGMTCEQTASVKKEGSITVSARHLYDIIRSLKNQEVTVKKLDNNWAEVKSGSNQYKMLGMAAEDFQDLPDVSKAKTFEIDPAILKDMIDKTIYAVSNDETRYNLNGSYLEKTDSGMFRMVATDGHRLSMIDEELSKEKNPSGFEDGVIIPKKGLVEMKRLVESEEDGCKLGIDGSNLVFKIGQVTVVMRLLDGQFPEYRQVVPKSQKIKIGVNRKNVMESLRRVSILSSDRTLGLKMGLSKGKLTISTSNPDLGEAREEMQVEYEGKDLVIGFNARYLIDALSSIETEMVEVSLDDNLSPGVLRPAGTENYTCVVMPMRI